MEEQKKENLPENTEAENSLEDTSEAQKAAQPAGRSFLWMLAGVYLLYTGYSLAAAVIRGEEGATPIFLLIGIVFLTIGAGLVFTGGKNLLKANKMKQEPGSRKISRYGRCRSSSRRRTENRRTACSPEENEHCRQSKSGEETG